MTFLTRDLIILYSRSLLKFTKRLNHRISPSTSLPPSHSRILLTLSLTALTVLFFLYCIFPLPFINDNNNNQQTISVYQHLNISYHAHQPKTKINIWYQHNCKAYNLSSIPSKYSYNHFPYAILRDAVFDNRPSIKTCFNHSSTTTSILLIISVHNSARLSNQSSRSIATLYSKNNEQNLNINYVLHSTKFLLDHKRYEPGARTIHGNQETEWHIGISINTNILMKLQKEIEKTYLSISIKVLTYSSQIENVMFKPNITLSCIQGLQLHLNKQLLNRPKSSMNGSVLISSNPLYGIKRNQSKYYKEIAHFAARALTGPIRFDAVVMSITLPATQSDIYSHCHGYDSVGCNKRMISKNHNLLNTVALEIQKELIVLGFQDLDIERKIILMPVCTLGSDSKSSESWNPCSQAKHNGQYWSSILAYAVIAPFFKWAASYDLDEFLNTIPNLKKMAKIRQAENVFNEVGRSSFVIQWMNFKLGSMEDSRELTRILSTDKMPILTDKYNSSRSSRCYDKLGDKTGKSVVRYDVGLGFSIHHPIVVKGSRHRLDFKQSYDSCRGLRTWHARFSNSKGSCEFKAKAQPMPDEMTEGDDAELLKMNGNLTNIEGKIKII